MLYQIFSIIIYFLILSFFGWQVSKVLLKENRREFLVPLSLAFGIFLYIFILNISSYFISIEINFYLILVFFLIIGLGVFFFKKTNQKTIWYFGKKWRFILLITFLLIIIFYGFSAAREIEGDELEYCRSPLASTIAEGNFPVQTTFIPSQAFQYHYASELWKASLVKISGVKLWFVHDLQAAIACGLFFALSFILVFYFTQKKLFSYITALITLFGGGLNFFFGFKGVFNYLYRNGNFAFVADMIHGKIHITFAAAQSIAIDWAIVAFPIFILIFYLYFNLLDKKKEWIKFSILISVLLCVLALSAETYFAIILFSFLVFPIFCKFFVDRQRNIKMDLKYFLFINILTWPIVIFQGGILTKIFKGQENAVLYDFFVSINPFIMDVGHRISIFSYHFILNWGLLLILIIPALIYAYKKKNKYLLLLGLVSLVAYAIPFVIHIREWSGEIRRVLFLVPPLWSILVSLFLLNIYQPVRSKINHRFCLIIFALLFAFLCFDSILFVTAHLANPFYRPDHNESFWGEPEKVSQLEMDIYLWAKQNTNSDDYFFTFDKGSSHFPNRDFVMYAGRFAPTFQIFRDQKLDIPEASIYQIAKSGCEAEFLKILNYRYLYINQYWPEGLEEKCLSNNDLELVFDNSVESRVSKIYLIKDQFRPNLKL